MPRAGASFPDKGPRSHMPQLTDPAAAAAAKSLVVSDSATKTEDPMCHN